MEYPSNDNAKTDGVREVEYPVTLDSGVSIEAGLDELTIEMLKVADAAYYGDGFVLSESLSDGDSVARLIRGIIVDQDMAYDDSPEAVVGYVYDKLAVAIGEIERVQGALALKYLQGEPNE